MTKPTFLIPVELQVREFEPKLLLACVAAARGFPALIGPRREMHFHISRFPGSVYLSKSTTKASHNVFRNLGKIGCKIVVWDEEALVSLPPRFYYRHRLSADALRHVDHLFAWGEENAELWRHYSELPAGMPIHVTGNPRGDLLRLGTRGYYEDDVKALREAHGDFILLNTNFNLVNAFYPEMNMLMPDPASPSAQILSRRSESMGLSREYAERFTEYKLALLNDFTAMIPALERAFPECTIVIRPHPAENQDVYHRTAAACRRVRVTNKGNVVPWLLAAKALIHNGCTTGIEAYAVSVPAVAYRSRVNEEFDRDFHRLPNELSHQCRTFAELEDTLKRIVSGRLGIAPGEARRSLMGRHLAAQEGPLACERIIDVIEEITRDPARSPGPRAGDRLRVWVWANRRRFKKSIRGYRAGHSNNRPEFLRHRYPEIPDADVRRRVDRFQSLLGIERELKIERFAGQFFLLN